MPIGALLNNFVALPIGHLSTELQCLQIREDMMIAKPAQATAIMTANFKLLSLFVPGAALSLDVRNGCDNFVSDSRILSHDVLLEMLDCSITQHPQATSNYQSDNVTA
jgi:hypothetical protein